MSARRARGSALTVGLMLLTLVTLLGLAAAGSARVERLLAQNETFRENAAFAASAGIEMSLSAILASSDPLHLDQVLIGDMPGTTGRYETRVRFAGYASSLPQAPEAGLAGAHFDIVSTGHAARGATDRQQARVLLVVDANGAAPAAACEPAEPRRCFMRGELVRLSWQRLRLE